MKKVFKSPNVKVIKLESSDIICTSGHGASGSNPSNGGLPPGQDPDWVPPGHRKSMWEDD